MLPRARESQLVIRELAAETLVYDLERNKVHCLNRTSSFIWKHCDGRTTTKELAERVHECLGLPTDESVVRLALEQFDRRHLLQDPVVESSDASREFRRTALKKLALTAATLPFIMTMAAPKAIAQFSPQEII